MDASSARTHFSIPGSAAAVRERFGALTAFNDDVLGPSMASQPRTYAHVEVITYVVDGYFRHDDTLGSDFVLQHGDVERFSFGSGAGDMMKNNSDTSDLRSIVLSIDARDRVGTPAIDHRSLKRSAVGRDQTLIDVAIDDTRNPSPAMPLHQRGRVAVGLPGGFDDRVRIEQDYGAYIYAISGGVGVGDVVLAEGDVATVTDTADLKIFGDGPAHALVVVVPLKNYG
jgi:redox-sensitive bicupin YhaK (pirin superfamily)